MDLVARESGTDHGAYVQTFTREMIQQYLDRADLTYLRDNHGDFRVDFAHDDDLGCAPSFWLMAVGTHDEIYGIEARSTRRFGRDQWDWALFAVNEWNKRMRYPKAYFYVSDPDTDRTGEIRLEQYTDLEEGAHQDLVDNLTYSIMSGAMRFWTWLNQESVQYRLASIPEDHLDG